MRLTYQHATLLSCLFLAVLCTCASEKPKNPNMTNKPTFITENGLILEHEFRKKNGQLSELKEFYFLSDSKKKYFIKFCESKISKPDMQLAINTDNRIKVVYQIIKRGEWDNCKNDMETVQSRIGEYITIENILPAD